MGPNTMEILGTDILLDSPCSITLERERRRSGGEEEEEVKRERVKEEKEEEGIEREGRGTGGVE